MKNQEIAKIFNEMASFLKMDEVAFKPYAYQKAARALKDLEIDVGEIYNQDGVKGLKKFLELEKV